MRALVFLDSWVADRLVGRLIGQMPPWIRPVDAALFCTTGAFLAFCLQAVTDLSHGGLFNPWLAMTALDACSTVGGYAIIAVFGTSPLWRLPVWAVLRIAILALQLVRNQVVPSYRMPFTEGANGLLVVALYVLACNVPPRRRRRVPATVAAAPT
jgi:hypothetical protein